MGIMLGHILMTLARGVGLRPVPNSGWLLRMVDAVAASVGMRAGIRLSLAPRSGERHAMTTSSTASVTSTLD